MSHPPPHRAQILPNLSDVTISLSPQLMDIEDTDGLGGHRKWLETVQHGRARRDSIGGRSEATDFPSDDSGDDFKFNLFGPSRHGRRLRRNFAKRVHRMRVEQMQADSLLVDLPSEAAAQPVSGSAPAEGDSQFIRDQAKLSHLYYISLLKLDLRMAILSKVIQVVILAKSGFMYFVGSWISLGVNLVMNIASSAIILWRFSGKYSLPEESVSPELRTKLLRREKRCVTGQSVCKLLCSVSTISLAVYFVNTPRSAADHDAFMRSLYVTGGIAAGGATTNVGLSIWNYYLANSRLGTSIAISSENVLSWLTTAFSVEIAVVAFYLINVNADMARAWEVLSKSYYVEVALGVLQLVFAIRDWVASLRDLKTTHIVKPQEETIQPLEEQEEEVPTDFK